MHQDLDRSSDRGWVLEALRRLDAEYDRTADTHLHQFPLPASFGVDLYVKDESAHPTGSLKHRLARSLILYGLCNGWITEGTTLVEASSGSTAVSEAYFARLLDLPFVAVLPRSTSQQKVDLIEVQGGRCHFVDDAASLYSEAERIAIATGGHYLDQFTYAERATDWRGNNNIAESIFRQLRTQAHPVPHWIVVGAGTGGTSATLGRYVRYHRVPTRVAVVDPEGSAFFDAWANNDRTGTASGSRIEGIGRPRVEPSFLPQVIDRMIRVPDAASLAAMRLLQRRTGLDAGGSSGTALYGALLLVADLIDRGEQGSVVMLLCDRGDRYRGTYDDESWLANQGLDLGPPTALLEGFLRTGAWEGR